MRTAVLVLAGAVAAEAFAPAPLATPAKALNTQHSALSRRDGALSSLQMGFFDNLTGGGTAGKVDDRPPTEPVQKGLPPVPGKVLITFSPSGAQVYSRPGERIGDAARRAGLAVPYGCKEGVCGTCTANMKQPNGYNNEIRMCRDIVPKTNLDSPDRDKMWGDLRGGKKSVAELRSTPEELTVIMGNQNQAMKKKATWEATKDQAAARTKDWLDPNYKPPAAGGAAPPPPPKRGWPFG